MDLKQTKLTKTEWENTEIPVGPDEKRILKLICDGFHDVSIKTNLNQSLYQLIKIPTLLILMLRVYQKTCHTWNRARMKLNGRLIYVEHP